jgi:hypothetical protein
MTPKDYIGLAEALAPTDYSPISKAVKEINDRVLDAYTAKDRVVAQIVVSGLAHEIAAELGNTNPRFDRDRFLTACGVEQDSEVTRLSAKNQRRHHE